MSALQAIQPPVLAGWRHVYSGKVRDLYLPVEPQPGGDVVLIVASDRISAYDHVLASTIPDKGKVLTALTLWWFDQLADLVPNHLVSTEVPAEVAGRAMICRRLVMFQVECVARGYLAGSGLQEYQREGTICGLTLPAGLQDGSRLPKPIFTPTTKAGLGSHDESITMALVAALVGPAEAERLRALTLRVYRRAEELARERGLILADTKLEFGRDPHSGSRPGEYAPELILGDEVLTPDSSRFWPVDGWQPGGPQPSFDKQFVRDWLTSPDSGWDRDSGTPPPPLPEDVVARTRDRYLEAYQRLTGSQFG